MRLAPSCRRVCSGIGPVVTAIVKSPASTADRTPRWSILYNENAGGSVSSSPPSCIGLWIRLRDLIRRDHVLWVYDITEVPEYALLCIVSRTAGYYAYPVSPSLPCTITNCPTPSIGRMGIFEGSECGTLVPVYLLYILKGRFLALLSPIQFLYRLRCLSSSKR